MGEEMSDKVVMLRPMMDVPTGLRNIADAIEAGEYDYFTDCTVVLGTNIFSLGEVDDSRAAVNAVWDMTYGIHKLMAMGLTGEDG